MRLALFARIAFCLVAVGAPAGAQSPSTRPTKYPDPTAAMKAAKQRADSLARLVERIVVVPDHLEFQLGDSVYSDDVWRSLRISGFSASGDSVPGFAKAFMLQPSPALVYSGLDLLARQRGTAVLWIYVGTDMNRRFFTDTAKTARVTITVK